MIRLRMSPPYFVGPQKIVCGPSRHGYDANLASHLQLAVFLEGAGTAPDMSFGVCEEHLLIELSALNIFHYGLYLGLFVDPEWRSQPQAQGGLFRGVRGQPRGENSGDEQHHQQDRYRKHGVPTHFHDCSDEPAGLIPGSPMR